MKTFRPMVKEEDTIKVYTTLSKNLEIRSDELSKNYRVMDRVIIYLSNLYNINTNQTWIDDGVKRYVLDLTNNEYGSRNDGQLPYMR